jgi:uncharacterized protein HemY
MEQIKIDAVAAELIVQSYQKIEKLKQLLSKDSFVQLRNYLEAGAILNQLMDSTFKADLPQTYNEQLSSLNNQLNTFLSQAIQFQDILENKEVVQLLSELNSTIIHLQSNNNA